MIKLKIPIKGAIIPDNDKPIYDFCGLSATCPQDVHKAIERAAGDKIELEVNSPGGHIDSASEIYTALIHYPGDVLIRITGHANSAASMIAMARYCEMSPTAMMMIHNVSTGAQGDYHDMEKVSEALKAANQAIAAAYMNKSGMSEKEALDLMDSETWLTAKQALNLKLVDRIMTVGESIQNKDNFPILSNDQKAEIKNLMNKQTGYLKADAELQLLNLRRLIK